MGSWFMQIQGSGIVIETLSMLLLVIDFRSLHIAKKCIE